MTNGWNESAVAWINAQGTDGDFGRKRVLDAPMTDRVAKRGYRSSLDIGCGEGRFCRNLRRFGIGIVGIDPTKALVEKAVSMDVEGDYVQGIAEKLPFLDNSFDLVVSYLSLIDIEDYRAAIAEMARVLRPGGKALIANLTGMRASANEEQGVWQHAMGVLRGKKATQKDYMAEHASWQSWNGIRVKNWHRPVSAYMQAFLSSGLELRLYDEPLVPDPQTEREHEFNRAPWFVMMEWQKPVPDGYQGRLIEAPQLR